MNNQSIHVTIVEDDDILRASLVNFFQSKGFVVSFFANASGVVEFIKNGDTDILLCDIVLPDDSGLNIIKQLQDMPQLGKIFISGKTELDDRIKGLSLGVDDYICKPIDTTELMLRVTSLLNRLSVNNQTSHKDSSSVVRLLDFNLNLENRNLAFGNEVINLGVNEFKLLTYLFSQQGKICSRDKIIDALDNGDAYDSGRGLDILVSRVRKKMNQLSKQSSSIITYRGQGYMLPVN